MKSIEGTSNITLHRGKYRVFRKVGKKVHVLALCDTLIEALMVRDWCRENGWRRWIRPNQYIQKRPNGTYQLYKDFYEDGKWKRYIFGTFYTIEDARRERDLLIKCNWDYDLLCEGVIR